MIIPIILIVLATLAAGVVAYGTHPTWGHFEHGLRFIVWSRRVEWPLVTLAIVLCLLLVAMVILGRRRAWWLIGLGPILALFVHHFAVFSPDRVGAMAVVENPPFVDASAARGIADDDWVVAVNFAGADYAYPYAALFRAPVVIQSERDARMVLLWSAYANHVLAFRVSDAVKGRNLEVVSSPANALLVYDTRHGQFINGLKGLALDGRTPWGFGTPLLTTKTTWRHWRMSHSEGKVMALAAAGGSAAPTRPIMPAWRMPGSPAGGPASEPGRRVTVVGYRKPLAMGTSEVTAVPVNAVADGQQVLLFRPAPGVAPRAFDARLPAEPRVASTTAGPAGGAQASPSKLLQASGPALTWFVPLGLNGHRPLAGHPEAVFLEITSNTVWTADGAGVAGTKSAGRHLMPVPVDDDVDWDVVKYWYPELKVTEPDGSVPPDQIPAPPSRTKAGS